MGQSYALQQGDAELTLRHVRESGGEMSGELTVIASRKTISVARFNLSSLTARRTHIKYLADIDPATPWARLLEQFAQQAIVLHRQGPPVIKLNGSVPAGMERSRAILPPMLYDREPTIIFGEGGVRKSTFAAAVAVSVESGREIVPGMRPVSGKVMILDWEDEPWTWQERMHAFGIASGFVPDEIDYQQQTVPLYRRGEEIAAYVDEHSIGLMVIDSVGMATGSGTDHSPAEESVLRFYEALRLCNCAKLLIDHKPKAEVGQQKRAVGPYGSIYKVNLARNVFELRGEEEPAPGLVEMLLVHTKTNRGPRHPALGFRLRYGEGTLRFEAAEVQAEELANARPLWQRMRSALRGGALSVGEMADQLDAPPNAVRAVLSRHNEVFIRLSDGRIGLGAS